MKDKPRRRPQRGDIKAPPPPPLPKIAEQRGVIGDAAGLFRAMDSRCWQCAHQTSLTDDSHRSRLLATQTEALFTAAN